MIITKEVLNSIKACETSKQKFINSFDKVIVPNGTTIIEVFDEDLFNDIRWLINNTPTGIKKLIFGSRVYRYEYDSNNNKIKEIHPSGDIYQWEYDSNNNRIKEIYPDGYVC